MNKSEIVHRIRGRLNFPDAPELIARVELSRFDPWDVSLQIMATGEKGGYRTRKLLKRSVREPVVIQSLDGPFHNLTLVHITGLGFQPPATIDIVPDEIWIGIDRPRDTVPDELYARVDLTPSGILVPDHSRTISYTGAIEVEDLDEGAITISTGLGQWSASENYDYFETAIAEDRVTSQVQRAVLRGHLSLPKDKTLAETHEAIVSEVNSICRILSLAYRRPIAAYAYEYTPTNSEDQSFESAIARIRRRPYQRKDRGEELIAYRGLCEGRLNSLWRSFVDHPRSEDLSRAVSFTAASHTSQLLEDSYFLAFSALDLLVQILDGPLPRTPSNRQWKRIQKSVRRAVKESCAAENADVDPEPIIKKIPELRRPPTRDRIQRAVDRGGVDVTDLWPNLGFDAGIARAVAARNELFHLAKTNHPNTLYGDRIRVATLFERLVLKELEFPSEHLYQWRDQPLKWENRRDSS